MRWGQVFGSPTKAHERGPGGPGVRLTVLKAATTTSDPLFDLLFYMIYEFRQSTRYRIRFESINRTKKIEMVQLYGILENTGRGVAAPVFEQSGVD